MNRQIPESSTRRREPSGSGKGHSSRGAGAIRPDPERFYYDMHHFLVLPDADAFLVSAYECILKRPPDRKGYDAYRRALEKDGRLRQQVIAEMVLSGEGRRQGVLVVHLRPFVLWEAFRCAFPLGARFFAPLVRLFHRCVNLLQQDRARRLMPRFAWEEQMIASLRDVRCSLESVADRTDRHKHRLDDLLARYRLIKSGMQQTPAVSGQSGDAPGTAPSGPVDDFSDFYLDFQAAFRGPPEVLRERLLYYLPLLPRPSSGSGRVADLGCGRGQWLQLLGESGYSAVGLDSNPVMRKICMDQGLDVSGERMLAWLGRQPDASFAGITAFHLIEHLPFDELLGLFREAGRLLEPGGALILETQNPESLRVSAYAFYHDPTHRNPLTPELLEFTARYMGFGRVELHRLGELPESIRIREDTRAAAELNRLLNGPQDLALVAFREKQSGAPEEPAPGGYPA